MRVPVPWIAAAVVVGLALATVLLRLAWVGDDTYITLRTVENLAQGHGLVWNLDERVQTYTHPLWMLLLAGARLITGECYFGTIGVSYLLALVAIAMLMRTATSWPAAVAVGSLLLWSRSFGEYTVCGLENPLAFVLLAGLAKVAFGERSATRQLASIAWLTGLLATTRLDLVLLGGPVLLAQLPAVGWRCWWRRAAVGASPLLLWLGFATFYYGTPLPVTVYAKALSHGLPALTMARQGLHHFEFMALYDPLTLGIIALGIGVGLRRPVVGTRALAVGAALYCAYIVKVGGDFMGGRFFTPPLVVALTILARTLGSVRPRWSVAAIVLAPVLALAVGLPPWFRGPAAERQPTWHHHGILDERSADHGDLGLFAPTRRIPVANAGSKSLTVLGWSGPIVASAGKAGVYAFEGGEQMQFFDPLLCDPLLARLPMSPTAKWRIGHIPRDVPAGYLESLAFGGDRIHHPGLRRFHAALRRVIATPLLEGARWQAMWGLWTGAFDDDLQSYIAGDYRSPPRIDLAAAELAVPLRSRIPGLGPLWFTDEGARVIPRGGLAVRFPTAVTAGQLAVQLTGEFRYRCRCLAGGAFVADVELDLTGISQLVGMVDRRIELPASATFDTVQIDTIAPLPHIVAAIGSLRPE